MESNKQHHALTVNQQILSDSIRELEDKFSPFFGQLSSFLQAEGETLCYAKFWARNIAAMRLAPSPQITRQFGISLEIPILIATFSGQQPLEPRILRHLDTSTELRQSSSADKDIAILVVADDAASDYVRDRKRFGFPILIIKVKELQNGYYKTTTLRKEFTKLLQSINHFDFSNEITSKTDFFGRVAEIDAVTNLAISGQNVGLFGLRRAGKTSLLYQIQSQLEIKGIKTIYIQLNSIGSSDELVETFLMRLVSKITDKATLASANSELLNPDGSLKLVEHNILQRRWVHEFIHLFETLNQHLVILMDETDLANEEGVSTETDQYAERSKINKTLQQLRGIIQIANERGFKRLSFISAGVASSIFSQSTRFGRENQLFGFASIRSLKPMTRAEMREMVRTLGKRSGLKFESNVLFDTLLEEYGGHPYLTRLACSKIANIRTNNQNLEVPYRVREEDIRLAIDDHSEGSASDSAWQTLQSFLKWYPEEARQVMTVVADESARGDPTKVTHAIDFGLLDTQGNLRMHTLRRYASRK